MTTPSIHALVRDIAPAASMGIGSHRERAIGLIDQAIGEVRAGIAFTAH